MRYFDLVTEKGYWDLVDLDFFLSQKTGVNADFQLKLSFIIVCTSVNIKNLWFLYFDYQNIQMR